MQKKNKDRYRIQFCDKSFYSSHQKLFEMWKSRFSRLSRVEKLQAWVVALSCLRRPQDWFGGPRENAFLKNTSFLHSLTLHELFLETPILIPPKILPTTNVFDFINQYRVKAVPESCFRSLVLMTDNTYPLLITSEVSTAEELLKLQLQRQRLVYLNENYSAWPETLYSDRDYLGFILHDLIHADHFFSNPIHRDGQLGFYRFVEKLMLDADLLSLMKLEKFKDGFEYIISDMNSHPLHLFQTLHSLLFQNANNDLAATKTWQHWLELGSASCNQAGQHFEALCYINSPHFNSSMAEAVEEFCQNMGRT